MAPHLPLGLLSLQAAAAECGYRVDILSPSAVSAERTFESSDELAQAIADVIDCAAYDVVGLSAMCGSLHHSLGVATLLKARAPALDVWLGGPQSSVAPRLVLERFPFIDAVFVGEAEESLRESLPRLKDGCDSALAPLAGVCTKDSFSPRAGIRDLDDLPLVSHADDYLTFFSSSPRAGSLGGVPLEVERGCRGRCRYCSTRHFWGSRIRYKTPERIVAEMDSLHSLTGESAFTFMGDNLAAAPRRLWDLCDHLSRERPEYCWAGALGLDGLQSEALDRLWAGGCRGLFVGLESASQETLDRIGKRLDIKQSVELLYEAIERGFLIETSFIVGFPWETSADLKDTCRLHAELLRHGVFDSQVQMLCPISGTDLERSEHSCLRPGRNNTATPDPLPFGPGAEALMASCPELFTHFCHFETENVSLAEVRATVLAAELLAREARRRTQESTVD